MGFLETALESSDSLSPTSVRNRRRGILEETIWISILFRMAKKKTKRRTDSKRMENGNISSSSRHQSLPCTRERQKHKHALLDCKRNHTKCQASRVQITPFMG